MRPEEAIVSPGDSVASLVERLRGVHTRMVEAVLAEDGLGEVARLAAAATGGDVVLVLPGADICAVAAVGDRELPQLAQLRAYVADRLDGGPAPVPDGVACEVPVASGDEVLGAVLLIGGDQPVDGDARGILEVAAMAALTELALREAREQVRSELRGSFLEELRAGVELPAGEVIRRAARLGCDLTRGALVLSARPTGNRPHHVIATLRADFPRAFVQQVDDRVYAVLPPADGDEGVDTTVFLARRLAERLGPHASVGTSSFYVNPAELGRAIQEADVLVDVLSHADLPATFELTSGTYRLLLHMLARHPEELYSFHADTVAPIAKYDEQYRTELVETLAAYLDHNGNMNATAGAIYAHRHTVAYRLERIRELSGLDPARLEEREQLSLGLKIHRLIAHRLPR
jgi:sugar diacid utilization regulator